MPKIDWIGKEAAARSHLDVPYRLLRCNGRLSAGDADAGNLLVQGDNLEALRALMPYYAGRVKCIYIDPPYNTGNEGWKYNDRVDSPQIRRWLGKTVGGEADDLARHDKWLCMMHPRLRLLRDFLSEDGVIFVSIDDNEQHHLRMLMDEIFGANNFVETLIWKKKGGAGNTESYIGDLVEYVLMYSKNKEQLTTGRRLIENVEYPYHDEEGYYRLESLVKTDKGAYQRDTMKFGVTNPSDGKKVFPPEGKRWIVGEKKMLDLLAANMLHFYSENGGGVKQKSYYTDSDPRTSVFLNLLLDKGSLKTAKDEMEKLGFEREDFDTPKPSTLIKHLLAIIGDKNALIMDSFAGSGTTAHAVLAQNAADGGARKFILVEMEEGIARDITAKRIRKAVVGYKSGGKAAAALGGGFRFCTLGAPLFDENGNIGGDVRFADLAAHIFFSETGSPIPRRASGPLLGVHGGRAIYLLFNGIMGDKSREGGNMLTAAVLRDLPAAPRGASRVVYAEGALLSAARLAREGIEFRQIPYRIRMR